jgi:lysophospholipase L1-like esterase
MHQRFVLLSLAVLMASCGGEGPSKPIDPTEPPVPTHAVTATVFYDENGNGKLDASEACRVPGVEVVIGTGSGRSEGGTGRANVTGIREGSFEVGVRIDSVPSYYQPLPAGTIQVPAVTTVNVPLTLPIYDNQANVYFGYGDSITAADPGDRQGYAPKLQNLLGPHFGRAQVDKFGRAGTNSGQGLERAPVWIPRARAAYVLILYGTNDWQDQTCQNKGPSACFTIDSLRGMIEVTRDVDSLPVLSTILPVNPATAPPGRNTWIDEMNVQIRALAREQQVLLADANAEFKASSNLASLFIDDVHPNDAGYQVLAQAWFKAITRGRAAAASSQQRRFGFRL